jgi:hypothetical protein
VLFAQRFWEPVARGEVTVTFRRWKPFTTDVRKLKNLGLTMSLPVGYELSPRGQAYLDGG